MRKEALKVCGGIWADTLDGEVDIWKGEKRSAEEIMEEDRKRREQESRLPLGVCEPNGYCPLSVCFGITFGEDCLIYLLILDRSDSPCFELAQGGLQGHNPFPCTSASVT